MDPEQNIIPFQQRASNSKADADQTSQVNADCETSRLIHIKYVKSIIYGNLTWYLGPQMDGDGHSHQWNVYLKAYNNEDMSVFVECVHFKLHDSYAAPIRVCHSPPYEVTERGGSEFEVLITIFYRDSNELPVTISHYLKLFDRDRDGNARITTVPFRYELYDKLVFSKPTLKMYNMLSNPKFCSTSCHPYETETVHDEQIQKIEELEKKMNEEVAELQAEVAAAMKTLNSFEKFSQEEP